MLGDHGLFISEISKQKWQLVGYNCQFTRHICSEPTENDRGYDLYVQCLGQKYPNDFICPELYLLNPANSPQDIGCRIWGLCCWITRNIAERYDYFIQSHCFKTLRDVTIKCLIVFKRGYIAVEVRKKWDAAFSYFCWHNAIVRCNGI